MNQRIHCENCLWWELYKSATNKTGKCKRYPAKNIPLFSPRTEQIEYWPEGDTWTDSTDFCGEAKRIGEKWEE